MGEGLVKAFAAASGLEAGMYLMDNDPRMPNRRLRIARFEADKRDSRRVRAVCVLANGRWPREYKISTTRIFADGKPRRYGFSVARA